MSLNRRQFLVATTRSAAGLILPAYYDKVLAYFENHGEPLLEVPAATEQVLYVGDWENELYLGENPYDAQPPSFTWREFFEYCGYDDMEYALEQWGFDEEPELLDEPACEDTVIDAWARTDSPNARAHHYLWSLDLGPDLVEGRRVGGLEFIDGPMPGNDYLGVRACDGVSLSLLQNRFNELGEKVRIEFI
jgi:hypothetical protein